MMRRLSTIFAAHGGPSSLAHQLQIPVQRAHKWRFRDAIPARYWLPITRLGRVTAEDLTAAHADARRGTMVQNV